MPLSQNDQVNKTADDLVNTLRSVFGTPLTDRPAHAKGQLAKGSFTPTPAAAALSTAKLFHQPSTPLIVRFSSATGIPHIPDNNPSANPRGLAVRFLLSDDGHTHYDIIAHSANGFAVRRGEDLLEMLQALQRGSIDKFLTEHPHAKEFNQNPPGFPKSFATEQFFGVNAFKFIDDQGTGTWFRYRLVPLAGFEHLTAEEGEVQSSTYLYDELVDRIRQSSAVKFELQAQIAEAGDTVDDATQIWPESRKLVTLGTVEVDHIWDLEEGGGREQKRIIFDPVPRQISGIEASADPLIDVRAALYLISGKKRREASGVA